MGTLKLSMASLITIIDTEIRIIPAAIRDIPNHTATATINTLRNTEVTSPTVVAIIVDHQDITTEIIAFQTLTRT